MPSKPPEIYKNGEKTGGFAHVFSWKSTKTPFFTQKYLKRYTHETFFEEYMNFETHYLSHYRVIPLQSFGSHIRPKPHGLGLKGLGHEIRIVFKWYGLISLGEESPTNIHNFLNCVHIQWELKVYLVAAEK
jgi:hypothetical protein